MKPKIYFYVPVFNEQETVGILLYRIGEVMKNLRFEYQVLLTLDACTDESPEVVGQYLKVMPLSVTDNEQRRGYGASLLEAVKLVIAESENPKRDFFLVVDGDFANDPSYMTEMVQHIDRNVDFYTGNRLQSGQKIPSLRKRLALSLARFILRLRRVEPGAGADLLTTFRGARVQLLRRNSRSLEMLDALGPGTPPPASALLLLLILSQHSRKTMEIPIAEKSIRRRSSRFRFLSLLRFLIFSELPEVSREQPEPQDQPQAQQSERRSQQSERRPQQGERRPQQGERRPQPQPPAQAEQHPEQSPGEEREPGHGRRRRSSRRRSSNRRHRGTSNPKETE
jgi:hypothetical protein